MKPLNVKTTFVRKIGLFLIDLFTCFIAGVLAGIICEFERTSFPLPLTITYSTLIGATVFSIYTVIFSGYRFVVRYTDLFYNIRLVIAFVCSYITELLILGGLYGFTDGTVFTTLQTSFAFCAMVCGRFIYQFIVGVKGNKLQRTTGGPRVMIIGAGWTGKRVISDLNRDSERYTPVCIIDDDPEKQNMLMENVPIVGTTETIEENASKYNIQKIIFAIPSASISKRNEIMAHCFATGKEVNILPAMSDLVAKADLFSLIRKVKLEDLLEREQVTFEASEVGNFLRDKVCLVTGGGGSIGSELCRQIASFHPKKLLIADIYENSTFDLNLELFEHYGNDVCIQPEIINVTDKDAVDKLIREEGVQFIFHAAAHKHVPLMEHNPAEAIKNNVVGAWVVAEAAAKYKVEKMVMVSTDKAVNPTNVMGATKRFCEKIVEYWGTQTNDTKYSVTRFGNVLGSNGSVVHIFNRQIANGGPVRVTHPDIIRYFMTIPEAASLILQSAVYAKGGEVFVLDMGEPVKIVKLAQNMIRLAGFEPDKDIKIEFTGLRPGEKLFEELLMSEEGLQSTANKKIFIGNQSYIADSDLPNKYRVLVKTAHSDITDNIIAALCSAVETYKPDTRYFKVANNVREPITSPAPNE